MAKQTVVVDTALLGKMTGYIEMLVKDPYSTVFAPLSDIYRIFGLHDEAVAVAQKGTEMVPSYAPGFVSLGRALAEKSDPVGASEAYRRALTLDTKNLAALTGLASSCLGCGEADEALALLNQAQTIDPLDEVVLQLLPIVKKLQASVVSPPSVKVNHAPVTPSVSQPPDVVGVDGLDSVSAPAQLPPIATATLADIYIKQGFPERAIKVYRDLLVEDPHNREIRQRYDALLQSGGEELPKAGGTLDPPLAARGVLAPKVNGREALIALYERWLDAIIRRRADVC